MVGAVLLMSSGLESTQQDQERDYAAKVVQSSESFFFRQLQDVLQLSLTFIQCRLMRCMAAAGTTTTK